MRHSASVTKHMIVGWHFAPRSVSLFSSGMYEKSRAGGFLIYFQILAYNITIRFCRRVFYRWYVGDAYYKSNYVNVTTVRSHGRHDVSNRRYRHRTISQIPQYPCSISHITPFRAEMWTLLFGLVHYGIWNGALWDLGISAIKSTVESLMSFPAKIPAITIR